MTVTTGRWHKSERDMLKEEIQDLKKHIEKLVEKIFLLQLNPKTIIAQVEKLKTEVCG